MKKSLSPALGFIILFAIYHLPEFFDSFALMAICKMGILAVAFLIGRNQGWKGLEGFGLSLNNKWHKTLLVGLLAGFTIYTCSIWLSIGLKWETIISIETAGFFVKMIPLTLFMTFFPSIAEDLLTRGYLLGHYRNLKPAYWIVGSAIVYVLNHIWRLNEGLPVLLYLFLLGCVLGICVWTRQSLWLALGIHWGANIAFEMSNAGLQLKPVQHLPGQENWPLVIVWGITSALLLIVYRKELNKPFVQ